MKGLRSSIRGKCLHHTRKTTYVSTRDGSQMCGQTSPRRDQSASSENLFLLLRLNLRMSPTRTFSVVNFIVTWTKTENDITDIYHLIQSKERRGSLELLIKTLRVCEVFNLFLLRCKVLYCTCTVQPTGTSCTGTCTLLYMMYDYTVNCTCYVVELRHIALSVVPVNSSSDIWSHCL